MCFFLLCLVLRKLLSTNVWLFLCSTVEMDFLPSYCSLTLSFCNVVYGLWVLETTDFFAHFQHYIQSFMKHMNVPVCDTQRHLDCVYVCLCLIKRLVHIFKVYFNTAIHKHLLSLADSPSRMLNAKVSSTGLQLPDALRSWKDDRTERSSWRDSPHEAWWVSRVCFVKNKHRYTLTERTQWGKCVVLF